MGNAVPFRRDYRESEGVPQDTISPPLLTRKGAREMVERGFQLPAESAIRGEERRATQVNAPYRGTVT